MKYYDIISMNINIYIYNTYLKYKNTYIEFYIYIYIKFYICIFVFLKYNCVGNIIYICKSFLTRNIITYFILFLCTLLQLY